MTIDSAAAPGKVLVVDDDEDHLLILGHHLRAQGHEVRTLNDPRLAVSATSEMRPDVVLLDHHMPGLSWLDVCRQLRADPANEFLPVILLTNDASLEVTAAAVAAGVNDFAEKSAPVEILRLRIKAAIRTKRLADLAARRYEDLAFLARLTQDLANSLEEDTVLAVAARAFERFGAAALYVGLLSDQDRPQLLSFGAEKVEYDRERMETLLSLAQGALRANLDMDEVQLRHVPAQWPASAGRPLVHRTLRANPRPRAWLALETTRALDEDELSLFDGVTDRLAAPLENARLYARVTVAHEEIADALNKLRQAQASLVHNEKMASIGQLAAGVAHEINNPLAFVISNLNVLRDYSRDLGHIVRYYQREMRPDSAHPSTLDPEFLISDLDSLISESLEGSNRVHGIVRNLKSFAHTGSGNYEDVDIQSAVESTLNLLGGELRQRCAVSRDLRSISSVRGDRGKLNQVFLNLIVNASEAIPSAREGRLTVRLFMEDNQIVFQVEDNGTGIPSSLREKIFEPFFTTKGIGRGTGLGLPITDEIVRQHGGSITVDSEEGRGTTFTVRLPARDTRPLPVVEVYAPSEDVNSVVVFIDDERFLLNAFRRAFSKTAQVKVAQGGEEAITLLQETPEVSVVFCDLLMPRISGMEVYQWICDHRPELIERFVILTAGANDDKYKEFLQTTQVPVIHKPFTVHEVQELINKFARRTSGLRKPVPYQ